MEDRKVVIKASIPSGGKAEVYDSVSDLMIAIKKRMPKKIQVIIKGGGMGSQQWLGHAFYDSEVDRIKLATLLQWQVDRCEMRGKAK